MARHKGKRKKRPRRGAMDRHHLTAKDYYRRRGEEIDNSRQNVCVLKVERHRAYHAIFLILSLEEAIEALHEQGQAIKEKHPNHWAVLFRDKSPLEAIYLLHRFHRIKGRCTRQLVGVCLSEVRHAEHRDRRQTF